MPEIVFSVAGPPSVLALRRIDGQPLSVLQAHAAWIAAGRELRRLHELPVPPGVPPLLELENGWRAATLWWADREWALARSQGQLPAVLLDHLHDRMRASFQSIVDDAPMVMLHGDCQAAHFIVTPDDRRIAGILDLGDASIGDPGWDLSVLTIWAPEHLEDVLEGYRATSSVRNHLAIASTGYHIIRHLGAARWLPEHGFDPRDEIAALEHYT